MVINCQSTSKLIYEMIATMSADPKRGHLCADKFTLMHNFELALYVVRERLQGMS